MKRVIFLTSLLAFILFSDTALAETYTNVITKDGKTYVTAKTVEGDKITIEQKIYDADGNLLDTKITVKDAPPSREKDTTQTVEKTVTPIVTKKPLPTATLKLTPTIAEEIGTEAEEVKQENNTERKISTYVQTNYPTYVSSQSGNLVVQTSSGDREMKISPDDIVTKAQFLGMDVVAIVKIEGEADNLTYQVTGSKIKKLLGFYEVYLPTTFIYNTQTGGLVKTEQSGWTKLADKLSI